LSCSIEFIKTEKRQRRIEIGDFEGTRGRSGEDGTKEVGEVTEIRAEFIGELELRL
jgi:hypothetical protein